MSYELISEEEYNTLPFDEPDRCFVEFENIVRRNMTRMIDENSSSDFTQSVREQYMATVAAVAAECNIPNVHFDIHSQQNFWRDYTAFALAVQGEVARIRVRVGRQRPYSVLLTTNTRTTIEHYISRMREAVQGSSELDTSLKKRIDEKLDQLAAELKTPRLNFGKSMAILAAVLAAIGSTVTIAADGRNAVAQIIRLIGEDKETEDAAAQRLAPPPRALPSPHPSKPPAPHQSHAPKRLPQPGPIDDEIPF
jgi:hypothetical protein